MKKLILILLLLLLSTFAYSQGQIKIINKNLPLAQKELKISNNKLIYEDENESTNVSYYVKVGMAKIVPSFASRSNNSKGFGWAFNEADLPPAFGDKIYYQIDTNKEYFKNKYNSYVLERNLSNFTQVTNQIGQIVQRRTKRFFTFESIFHKDNNLFSYQTQNGTNFTVKNRRNFAHSFIKDNPLMWTLEFFNLFDLDPAFLDDTDSDWDLGTFDGNWQVQGTGTDANLTTNSSSGIWQSQIFNANSTTMWGNITGSTEAYYGVETGRALVDGVGYPVDTTNLLLLYHLNNESASGENNSAVYDFSGNGNDGLFDPSNVGLYGDALLGNFSMTLNGTQRGINVSDMNLQDSFTLSAWVYAAGRGGVGATEYNTLFGISSSRRILLNSQNYRQFLAQLGGGNFFSVLKSTNYYKNRWVNLVYVYDKDNSQEHLYIDGLHDSNNTNSVADWDEDFGIGWETLDAYYMNGSIDEVSIWNRTLPSDEIWNLYVAGKSRNEEVGRENTTNDAGTYPKDLDKTGLVGLWHFNNDTGENNSLFYDFSGTGNNGTCTNCPTYNFTDKILGNASMNFDGEDDYIDAGNDNSLDIETFTISSWFNVGAIDGATDTLVGRRGSSGDWWELIRRSTSGIRFEIYNGATESDSSYFNDYNADEWHHAAVTLDNTSGIMQYYIDGSQVGSDVTGITGFDVSSSVNTEIGSIIGGSFTWNGSMDELSIWNRTLSAEEILNLYKRGALRLNLSARSCDDASCSGESYTQITNTSWMEGKIVNIIESNNQYFQYKFDYSNTSMIDINGIINNISIGYSGSGDAIPPSFSNRTPTNNSLLSSQNVQINISITDNNPANFTIFANFSGLYKANHSGSYISGAIFSHNSTLGDGTYIYGIFANDSLGNSNSTQNFTFTVDTTSPSISILSPANGAIFVASDPPNINFEILVSERSKNCTLYLQNSIESNESSQKRAYNFTIKGISGGKYRWNVTCYDLANNLGSSSTYDLEVSILSGGSSSIPQNAGGGGGSGASSGEGSIVEKSYTLTYICSKIKDFFQDDFNYTSADLTILQEDVRFDIDYIIPYATLESYIKNYDSYCLGKNPVVPAKKVQNKKIIIANMSLNMSSSIGLPLSVDLGSSFVPEDSDSFNLFDIINLLFPLEIVQSEEGANVVWQGKIRIIPALVILSLVFLGLGIRHLYPKKKPVDYSNPDEVGAEKA